MTGRWCYAGTDIPVIRGGAPDAPPAGSAVNSPTAQPSQAAPGATTSATGAAASAQIVDPQGRPVSSAGDDYRARYEALEAQARPWLDRFKDHDPVNIQRWVQHGYELQQRLERGDLTAKEARAAVAEHTANDPRSAQPADPYADWEDLSPREQATRQRQLLLEELKGVLAPELQRLQSGFEGFSKTQAGQMQLAMAAMRMSQETGVPFEELIASATEAASMTPLALLEMAAKAKSAPKAREQEIATLKAQWAADRKAEDENRATEALNARLNGTRLGAPLLTNPADRQKSRLETRGRLLRQIVSTIDKGQRDRAAS